MGGKPPWLVLMPSKLRGKRKTKRSTAGRRLTDHERAARAKTCRHERFRYRNRGTEAVCLHCGNVQVLKMDQQFGVGVAADWHDPTNDNLPEINADFNAQTQEKWVLLGTQGAIASMRTQDIRLGDKVMLVDTNDPDYVLRVRATVSQSIYGVVGLAEWDTLTENGELLDIEDSKK